MEQKEKSELTKIGIVALIGLITLSLTLFWLKGHKVRNYAKYTFYFRNINGLEEGAPVRWNGLRVGVVESVKPVLADKNIDVIPSDDLMKIGKEHINQARAQIKSGKIENLTLARELLAKGELEIALGNERNRRAHVLRGEHVEVKAVLTVKDLPMGFLNQVTIAPTGLIGEMYLDISTLYIDKDNVKNQNPEFVILEPVRIDSLIKANFESAEGVRDLTNRFNSMISDKDVVEIQNSIQKISDTFESFKDFKLFKHLI